MENNSTFNMTCLIQCRHCELQSNASEISQVWDVTDLYNVTKLENPNQTSSPLKQIWENFEKYVALDAKITLSLYKTANPKSQTKKPTQNNQGSFKM
jgi:hypothetical protein